MARFFLLEGKGCPRSPLCRDGLPALANPAYGEVMLSGNDALLEPAWLIGSLRDGATGQVLKWNNYLLPDAKPNVKLLTDTVFEGFVDSSAATKAEWLSTLKLNAADRAVAEVVVTRVSVTSVGPKQIDRARLMQEIVQRLPADQQNRYGVVIAYVDIAITSTRFQHYEVEGDVAGYGGRIGGDWYYKDKQKTTDHRLVAISAPLQFAVTTFAAPNHDRASVAGEAVLRIGERCDQAGYFAGGENGAAQRVLVSRRNVPNCHRRFLHLPESKIAKKQEPSGIPGFDGEKPVTSEANVTAVQKPAQHLWAEREPRWGPASTGNSASALPAYKPMMPSTAPSP